MYLGISVCLFFVMKCGNVIWVVPLDLGKELGFKDAPGLQGLRDLSSKEEATLCQINQDVPYNLTQVHATAHLLISKSEKCHKTL